MGERSFAIKLLPATKVTWKLQINCELFCQILIETTCHKCYQTFSFLHAEW